MEQGDSMTAEQTKRDGSTEEIDVNQEAECIRWTHELGVTAGELKAAVHYVGPKVKDVRRYLQERTLRSSEEQPFGEK